MKIRTGFVSNSSSSSFVCDFCGETASGWDMCLSEAEMFECDGDHTVCNDHRIDLSVEQLKAWIAALSPEDKQRAGYSDTAEVEAFVGDDIDELIELIDEEYTLTCMCPLCQLTKVTTDDMLCYLLAAAGRKHEEVEAEIQAKFGTLAEMNTYIAEQTEEKKDENQNGFCVKQQ